MRLTSLFDTSGTLGTIVAAMGCASCFPAIATLGSSMVLATLYLFWTDSWSTNMFYAGLAVMLGVSIWDIVSPPHKVCTSHKVTTDSLT